MKKLIILASLLLVGTLVFSQCIPPTKTATGSPANWPSSLTYNPNAPVDPPAYFSCGNYANSPLPLRSCTIPAGKACYGDIECVDPTTGATGVCTGTPAPNTGIRKFVDPLPSIPLAVADQTSYPGSDYYEIELGEYTQKMHSDLPATRLRGYRQINTTGPASEFHYLGPIIVAQKNRPVRIKFVNNLPLTGGVPDGNLFLPVDTTYMGAGMGPAMAGMMETDPQNPMCGMNPKPAGCFTENRATLHLHGGISPWISDGTPHQWITPAGERPYPDGTDRENRGISVVNVPDMDVCNGANSGCQTFYWTNQQSARLMFYHDHSWGITRLNVYAGEAAGYLIQDDAEKALSDAGLIPDRVGIPLVIQDKTFVPKPAQLATQDPLWDTSRWGGEGNLWFPHVYVPAQNPDDASGVNAFGRWMYGPWFWPPTADIKYPPVKNPYYDPACNADITGWCEPEWMPATPYLSSGMEAFMDTPIVNGTAYPTVTLEPKAYRFRILNAADDRFLNLSLYQAASQGQMWVQSNGTLTLNDAGAGEVALNAAEVAAAQDDPVVFPTPDTSVSLPGPNWIVIGTEGGFLPNPAVVPPQPITWVTDPTLFNVGNVDLHSLLLAPAERADVIVDFTGQAGKTFILYNDAPAAFPARVASYDYYTGHPDMTDTGGAPTTLPGYGPNTRTVMQIVIGPCTGTCSGANLAGLQAAFEHHLDANNNPAGVFETSQHPIIVGQADYNSAYGTSFRANGRGWDGFARIFDSTSFSFKTLADPVNGLTMPVQNKAIHDEMGGTYDPIYGRMSGTLGLEMQPAKAFAQQFLLFAYANPPTEIIDGSNLPKSFEITNGAGEPFAGNELKVSPISSAADGTQIWKITHNGVDTHPIHFHLYDVQLLNRVGWDGFIRKPHPTELGWKDTLRISPLEDTIVALRPVIPQVPFDMPNSVRLIDPSLPDGAMIASATQAELNGVGFMPFAPNGEPIDIYNHPVNFGFEYVYHCHILSHEEMDMMRTVILAEPPKAPANLTATQSGSGPNRLVSLSWTDASLNETSFTIERSSSSGGPWSPLVTLQSTTTGPQTGTLTYTDAIGNTTTMYYYRVYASNLVGDSHDYTDPAINEGASFPTKTLSSNYSNVASPADVVVPAAPTDLVANFEAGPQVVLSFMDNATSETGFAIERAVNGGTFAQLATIGPRNNTGNKGYTDTTVTAGNSYSYRVYAFNGAGNSEYSNTASVDVPSAPAAPSNFTAAASGGPNGNNNRTVTLNWTDNSNNETGFTIQRATNATFTAGLNTATLGANVTTLTQTGLTRRTNYYYRIRSFNSIGTSDWVNATPFPVTTP